MLKTRVIGVVVVKEGIAVQSIGFRRYLPIGKPEVVIEYLNRWGIDEIVVLHIDATFKQSSPTAAEIMTYAKYCQVPLAIGGGVKDIATVRRIIQAGADKIIINTAAVVLPSLITEASHQFGDQCVVVSIDARRRNVGGYEVYTHSGTTPTGLEASAFAQQVAQLGAGEIFINSIDRDGAQNGYELELLQSVVKAVNIPVIACGGAGHARHMQAAMRTGVSAVAAANFFNYTEHSVILVKRYLVNAQDPVRLDSYANYSLATMDQDGRLAKQKDSALDALRFQYVAEEVI